MRTVPSVLFVLLVLSCTAATGDSPIATTLRDAGFTVRDAGMVEQPFFSVPAHVLVVNGDDLQLYEFPTAADAEAAAATVGPTGTAVGRSQISWMAPPHWYRRDRTIANYLGSNPQILAELQRLFGPQFAGQ